MLPKALVTMFLLIVLLAVPGCTADPGLATPPPTLAVASPTTPAPTLAPTPTAGVAPTTEERPTATLPPPSPTSEPTQAAAPADWQGNPLQPHTWTVGPVLLRYDSAICVDACGRYFSPFPSFILYSDGRLFTPEYLRDQTLGINVKQSILSRQEMCAIMNTFDAIGYFGYDPTAYYEIDREYAGLQAWGLIEANSWNPTMIDIGGAGDFLGREPLDPPLVMTYHLIDALKEELLGSEIYQPSEIIVMMMEATVEEVDENPWAFGDIEEWPLPEINLADKYDQDMPYAMWADDPYATPSPQEPPAVRLSLAGPEAQSLLEVFNDVAYPWYRTFEENGRFFVVSIRGLLPFETEHGVRQQYRKSEIPGPDTVYPVTSFTCTPEDGVLDVYEQLLRIGQ